jgi:hypothetical protein
VSNKLTTFRYVLKRTNSKIALVTEENILEEKLNKEWQAASEEMYKNTQGAGPQPGGDGGQTNQQQTGSDNTGKGPDVTDVDFEEVKDDKK